MGNTIVKRITYEEEISEQLEANLAEMEAIQKAVLSLPQRAGAPALPVHRCDRGRRRKPQAPDMAGCGTSGV